MIHSCRLYSGTVAYQPALTLIYIVVFKELHDADKYLYSPLDTFRILVQS